MLKIHFATWFEMTAPLVILATERGKGKGDNGMSKEDLDDDTELAYGDDEDEDTVLESQDDQTQRICKKKNKVKVAEDFSRFQTAKETMNTGNLLAARKLTT